MSKALTIGVAIGVAASFFGVGGAFLAAGQDWATSIGMGLFVAMWGGLGFGGMLGGVVWASRVEESAKRDRVAAREAARVAGVLPAQASVAPGGLMEDSTLSPAMDRVAS